MSSWNFLTIASAKNARLPTSLFFAIDPAIFCMKSVRSIPENKLQTNLFETKTYCLRDQRNR